MEINSKYYTLINTACERVKKVKGIDVSLSGMEFYGVGKYSHENIYKISLMTDKGPITIYQEEESLRHWGLVPWSGLSAFRPANFHDWPEGKRLTLAWCWAIYKYCTNWWVRPNAKPPAIEE